MKKVCKECGKHIFDERLIACPECNGELITNEQMQTITLNDQQKAELVKAVTKTTAKQLWGWFWKGFAGLAVLSFIYSGWTLDKIYNKAIGFLENKVNKRISEEFNTDRIKDTNE